MAVYLSPGVFVKEVDLSLYVPNLSTTAIGMVGLATKGPINEPQFITNPVQFASIFGDPKPDYWATYAALQYLHQGRQCWFVRVAEEAGPSAAAAATVDIYESSTAASVTGTVNNPITLTASNNVFTFIVDGAVPGFSVTLDLGGASSLVQSISQVRDTLNSDATFAAYLTASLSSNGGLVITRNVVGSNHSVRITGTAYTASNIFGFPASGPGTGSNNAAYGTGDADEKPYILGYNVTWPVAITTGANDILQLLYEDATAANITIAPGAPTSYTLQQMVDFLNADATFATHCTASSYASQLKVALKSTSAHTHVALGVGATDAGVSLFGNINTEINVRGNGAVYPLAVTTGSNDTLVFDLQGNSPVVDATFTIVVPQGTYATSTALAAAIDPLAGTLVTSAGATTTPVVNTLLTFTNSGGQLNVAKASANYDSMYLNPTTSNAFFSMFGVQAIQKHEETTAAVSLTVDAASMGTWGNNLSIEFTNVTTGDFDLLVYEKNILVETYRNLVKTPTTIPDPDDPFATIDNPAYVETAINGVSPRITVTNGTGDNALLIPNATGTGSKSVLTGGNDGVPTAHSDPGSTTDPSIFIGYESATAKTGLQLFRNPEELDINLIAVPGVANPEVINEMIDICQSRADCMAIVDPPYRNGSGQAFRPQEIVDWRNGAGSHTDHQAFNSSYAALYWPWLQIYDPISKTQLYTPPSGHVAAVYAFTDYSTDPWFAPAGLIRGRLFSPIKAEYNPTKGELDLLYSNNVNPIATFVRDGINVFGQKTLQSRSSALDRVNVRRLMLYLEKTIATATRQLLFQPNDEATWLQFVNLVDPFLNSVQARRGVIDYKVRCDSTTNTSDAIDRNEMHALIFIKPTKAAEFIEISFILTAQGASFDEIVF